MEAAAIQMLINHLNEKIEKISNQLEQHRAAKEFQEENHQNQKNIQQRDDATEFYAVKTVRENLSTPCNGTFNSTLEENFLINNLSQQLNENQASNKMQNKFDDSIDKIPYEAAGIAIERIGDQLCFEQFDKQSGKTLFGLIDIKVKNNYISKEFVMNEKLFELKRPIYTKAIDGTVKISHDITFLVVDFLGNFDFVLGMDGLKKNRW